MTLKTFLGLEVDASDAAHIALTGVDKQLMVDILCSTPSMMRFTTAEAKIAAAYMSARSFREGEVVLHEGSKIKLNYMMWVLDGETTFEARTGGGVGRPVTVTVLGAGKAIGTMSMFDDQPRSLHGVATVPTRCAVLTRAQLQKLCDEHPQVGTKLLVTICQIFSQALRSLTSKFKSHVRLNNVLNDELKGQEAGGWSAFDKL